MPARSTGKDLAVMSATLAMTVELSVPIQGAIRNYQLAGAIAAAVVIFTRSRPLDSL